MAPEAPLTYIIVLTWNGWEDTEACLRSLLPVCNDRTRLLVVDNGSSDGTPAKVRQAFPGVELIENGANLGFPGGNNVGIRRALAAGAEYIVLLNNDTEVDGRFAVELVQAAQRNPAAGMISSLVYVYGSENVIWFAGGSVSTWTGRSRHAGYLDVDRGQYAGDRTIDRPCACALLVTRRFLEVVGLMREDLFLYGEEIDWALRSRKHGFRCILAPRSKVWHKVSSSTGGSRTPSFLYYATRNSLMVLRDQAPVGGLLSRMREWIVLLVFLGAVLRLNMDRRGGIRNVLHGYRDYREDVTGPRP